MSTVQKYNAYYTNCRRTKGKYESYYEIALHYTTLHYVPFSDTYRAYSYYGWILGPANFL